jgi:hypothetical protein
MTPTIIDAIIAALIVVALLTLLGALLSVGMFALCAYSGLLFQYEACRSYLRKAAFVFLRIPLGYDKWVIVALCPLPVLLKSLDHPWDYYGEARAKEAVAKMKADRSLINAAGL